LANAAEGRRRLRAARFVVSKRRVFESNILFDTPGCDLGRSGRLLRIRQVDRAGLLTYKGPSTNGKHKSRPELELVIAEPRKLREILVELGYSPQFSYEKYRSEYRRAREGGLAMLDETPIGVYLELEGAPAWIDRSAHRLGFDESAYIKATYYGLYVDYCRRRGREPSNMVF
jgi:adenylate cyclase class 2